MPWKAGDKLTHRFNPALGPGCVTEVEGRSIVVEFPRAECRLRFAAQDDALLPMRLRGGARVLVDGEPGVAQVEVLLSDREVRLVDGRVVPADRLWPSPAGETPLDRLAHGDIAPVEDFANRLDDFHLREIREADGLGSFLGGRIRLFPHQLYSAERATRTDPVRWLLADDVGLGKTVEACLILNRLLRTGRADRTLIVTPKTLTIQWLGELWRKYHQVFVLLDEARLADVDKDHGPGFNPFDVHRQVVASLDLLVARPHLTRQAVEAGIDLLVVDEAHHLRRPPGHPGDPSYRAVAPIAALGRHVLLLTATPLAEDAHGFFRLLQLLRPEEFPEGSAFEARLERREPLPPCTSATRREDIGGLPPRVPLPVDVDDPEGWSALLDLERAVRALPATHAVERREKVDRVRRALTSGAALDAVLHGSESAIRRLARHAVQADPRTAWLAKHVKRWKRAGEKCLIFVADRATLEAVRSRIEREAMLRVAVFHEDLSPTQRDMEVARFRLPSGPSLLVSTECGGEGRNFEFCHRLVLFDLPWSPTVLEQRIGRLDRIGRSMPVRILYFRPPGGLGAEVVRLYESIGVFREPLGGFEHELEYVEATIHDLALGDGSTPPGGAIDGALARAEEGKERIRLAALHELHRDPFRPEMGPAILERVPADLETLTAEFVLASCERLGLHAEAQRGEAVHSIEFGSRALIDSLPGVPAGSSFLGTFDREYAVAHESLDFFASGHPLVEGLLAEMEDGPRGRVALLQIEETGEPDLGLLAFYRNGPEFEAVTVDLHGRRRRDWADRLSRRPLRTRRVNVESWIHRPEWESLVRRLASHLPANRSPEAVALVIAT